MKLYKLMNGKKNEIELEDNLARKMLAAHKEYMLIDDKPEEHAVKESVHYQRGRKKAAE